MVDLTLGGVTKSYGTRKVLDDIDLTIPDGELCVIVGPSGSGKTTLLRVVAGLEKLDSGTVAFDGEVVNDLAPRDRNLAIVFQEPALFPYLTAYGNLAFGLRARKLPRVEMIPRAEHIAAILGLSDVLHRYPRDLDKGDTQCVAIGHAIVRDAFLYLLDEPLARLDSARRDAVRDALKRLHQEKRNTVVYVTQDHLEAMSLADRLVLLRDGRVEQEGAPMDLYERPVSRFVAGFFGALKMNFLPGTLARAESGDAIRLARSGMHIPLPPNRLPKGLADGHSITLGIRPEHMMRAIRVSPPDGTLRCDADIEMLRPAGSRVCATFRMDGEPIVAELQAHDVSAPGERIAIDINLKRASIFDAASGKALTWSSPAASPSIDGAAA
jgi:multiple sugar transport system ATP-binding protein